MSITPEHIRGKADFAEELGYRDHANLLRDAADELEEITNKRDHFYNQFRTAWAALTPKSEDEKRGFERVLAILKAKLSDGGGVVGPSDVQRKHNDYYRGRRTAFEECAEMLRLALNAHPAPPSPSPSTDQGIRSALASEMENKK